jgi:hypothetical protein
MHSTLAVGVGGVLAARLRDKRCVSLLPDLRFGGLVVDLGELVVDSTTLCAFDGLLKSVVLLRLACGLTDAFDLDGDALCAAADV